MINQQYSTSGTKIWTFGNNPPYKIAKRVPKTTCSSKGCCSKIGQAVAVAVFDALCFVVELGSCCNFLLTDTITLTLSSYDAPASLVYCNYFTRCAQHLRTTKLTNSVIVFSKCLGLGFLSTTSNPESGREWGSRHTVITLINSGFFTTFYGWSDGSKRLYRLMSCF